jgi:hypothetical protein
MWNRALGTSKGSIINSIKQTTDGGYIVAGSNSSLVSGGGSLWVSKLDPNGKCCNANLIHTAVGSDWLS